MQRWTGYLLTPQPLANFETQMYCQNERKFNPFSTGKIEELDFWDAKIYTNFKHQ